MGFGKGSTHQNHWNQHQKHLLPKLLRVPALEEQQHWQVLGWSYGDKKRKPGGDLLQYLQVFMKYEILVQNVLG